MSPFAVRAGLWGVGALVVGSVFASQWGRISGLEADLAAEREGRAAATAAAASAATDELQRQLNELGRQATARQEALDAERELSAAARGDAVAAADAAERLRQRVAVLAASCRGPGTPRAPDAASGPAAADASDLLSDVFGRLEARGRELAAVADARGIAGATCERERDAVTTAEPR